MKVAAWARRRVAVLGAITTSEGAVGTCGALLVGSMLLQAPIVDLVSAGSRYHIRAWDLAWVVMATVGGACVIRRLRAGDFGLEPQVRNPILLILGLAALACISLFWVRLTFGADGFAGSAARALRLATIPVLAVLLAGLLRPARYEVIAWAVLLASCVAAFWALFSWVHETRMEVVGGRTATYGVTRAGGPFGDRFADGSADHWWTAAGAANVLGFWLAVACAAGTALLLGLAGSPSQPRVRSGIGGVLLTITGLGLVATQSREAWVAGLIAIAAVILIGRRRLPRRARLLTLAAVPAVLLLVAVVPAINARVLDTFRPGTFSFETGPRARVEAWEAGVRIGADRFPIGWGIGGIAEHPDRFGRSTVENVYLQVFAELGALGLALLVGFCSLGVIRSAVLLRDGRSQAVAPVIALGAFAVFCVHGMFGNTINDPSVSVLLGVAAGALAVPWARPGEG